MSSAPVQSDGVELPTQGRSWAVGAFDELYISHNWLLSPCSGGYIPGNEYGVIQSYTQVSLSNQATTINTGTLTISTYATSTLAWQYLSIQ